MGGLTAKRTEIYAWCYYCCVFSYHIPRFVIIVIYISFPTQALKVRDQRPRIIFGRLWVDCGRSDFKFDGRTFLSILQRRNELCLHCDASSQRGEPTRQLFSLDEKTFKLYFDKRKSRKVVINRSKNLRPTVLCYPPPVASLPPFTINNTEYIWFVAELMPSIYAVSPLTLNAWSRVKESLPPDNPTSTRSPFRIMLKSRMALPMLRRKPRGISSRSLLMGGRFLAGLRTFAAGSKSRVTRNLQVPAQQGCIIESSAPSLHARVSVPQHGGPARSFCDGRCCVCADRTVRSSALNKSNPWVLVWPSEQGDDVAGRGTTSSRATHLESNFWEDSWKDSESCGWREVWVEFTNDEENVRTLKAAECGRATCAVRAF